MGDKKPKFLKPEKIENFKNKKSLINTEIISDIIIDSSEIKIDKKIKSKNQ